MPETEILDTQIALTDIIESPDKVLTNILPVDQENIYASWMYIDEAVAPSPITNVVIAAYTTAQARLKLYGCLKKLDRRVLYFDTDSVNFASNNETGEYYPATWCLLGDMTDEIEVYGSGSYIEIFVSGGPKFYAFKVRSPDGKQHHDCKVKGITLNYKILKS